MKLSEAIRLGAMLRPQGFGHVLKDGRSCALGAAYEAIGLDASKPFMTVEIACYKAAARAFPFFAQIMIAKCPVCGKKCEEGNLYMPAHLNDVHRLSREEIADHVETIEAQLEANDHERSEPCSTHVPTVPSRI